MPSWKSIINSVLFMAMIVFAVWAAFSGYGYSRGEVAIEKVLDPLWSLFMLLIGMVIQAAREAAAKAAEAPK